MTDYSTLRKVKSIFRSKLMLMLVFCLFFVVSAQAETDSQVSAQAETDSQEREFLKMAIQAQGKRCYDLKWYHIKKGTLGLKTAGGLSAYASGFNGAVVWKILCTSSERSDYVTGTYYLVMVGGSVSLCSEGKCRKLGK